MRSSDTIRAVQNAVDDGHEVVPRELESEAPVRVTGQQYSQRTD